MVSSDYCIVSHSLIMSSNFPFGILWPLNDQSFFDYVFLFPLWYLLTIVLLVILWLRLLISPLVSFDHWIISHSSITSSNYPLCYLFAIVLSVILWLRLLISPLVSFGHCVISHSLITSSNFPLWYLLAIVLSIILWLRLPISPLLSFGHCVISHSLITSSNFPFGIFWSLYYQSFFDHIF